MMMYGREDTLPDYALEDDRYRGCENGTEAKILRLLLTYRELARRHELNPPIGWVSFLPDENGRSLRDRRKIYSVAEDIVAELGDSDPSFFVSFMFEVWAGRKKVAPKLGNRSLSGVAYPSWHYVSVEWPDIVERFLRVRDYQPTTHASKEQLGGRIEEALEEKAQRWIAESEGRTEEDYWLNPRHIVWPYFESRHIKHVRWLKKNEEKFIERFGVTLDEFVKDMQVMEHAYPHPSVPMTRLANEDFLDEHTLLRIDYIERAMAMGIDITTDEFEREMEDAINPIDTNHPDTVMYYSYGTGRPRREYDGQ